MQFVDFKEIVGPTYTLSSLSAECQRCVNLFPEVIESGKGQNTYYLKETPGLKNFFSFTGLYSAYSGYPIQAMHTTANGRVFFICLCVLWEIDSSGVVYFIGQLLQDLIALESTNPGVINRWKNSRWRMKDNLGGANSTPVLFIILDSLYQANVLGVDVVSIDLPKDTKGLARVNLGSGVAGTYSGTFYAATIPTLQFSGSKFVEFMDSFLITLSLVYPAATPNKPISEKKFQISPLSWDGLTIWDALNKFSVESSPDDLTAIIVNGAELWCFGPESYEVWYNNSASGIDSLTQAFQKISGAAYPIGCIAPDSVKRMQSKVFWLGSSQDGYGQVFMSQGLQAERISNTAIEQLIRSYVDITDAYAWCYEFPGHQVYVINFTQANATLAYDLNTGLWHEMAFRDPSTGVSGRHRGAFQTFAFGKNLVADYANGTIYELDQNTFTNFYISTIYPSGTLAPIIRYRRSPVLATQKRDVFHQKLELDMQTGVGDSSGSDPKVSIRWSDDNGNTWGNYHNVSIGKLGEYRKRVVLNRLGVSRKRVYEVYYNEPTPFRLISAELGIQVGIN